MRIYKPVVLHGSETWTLTLRKEHRLRVFENRVLRRIFRPKRDEMTGVFRKLYNDELHDLYCTPNIIKLIKSRRMTWAGHIARNGEKRNAYRLLVKKPEGKKPPGRTTHKWVDNIKMVFIDILWWCVLNSSGSGYGQVESSHECRNSGNVGKLPTGYTIGGLWGSS
jgi:hypothetical protein